MLRKLRKHIREKVTVKYYSVLTTHPADDSPSFPQVNRHEMIGTLNDVTPDGIVVDGKSIPFFEEDDMMKKGRGVPVGVGYITTNRGISLILYGKKVLYKSANPFTD